MLILRGKEFLKMAGVENAHQLSLRAQVSYPTVEKYVNRPADMLQIDMKVLSSILVNAIGMTREEILNMSVGELFEWKDD